MKPRLLDLFCGAGGCSVGYARAGFDVTGVDIEPHPDYPFPMVVADAVSIAEIPPMLVGPIRDALTTWGGLYVIENVPGAPLIAPVLLCGGSFGLHAECRDGIRRSLQRHRLFEANAPLMSSGCGCDARQKVGVYGDGGGGSRKPGGGGGYKAYPEEARAAMGIDWMRKRDDISDAIPPAYTEYLGRQLIERLEAAA